ncbi:MAG: hypothetical protein JRN26_03140 [Nitrososphaerota archaeon]|jgi:hypothetical protein|nr:hypothetical protein [Nitrososphaerota archaeon]MDG6930633.1 hypothetical protein [Nitrososphaerota archaeon]MDG6932742.1 hypothetical protein [Nitrososphaerota archaeon]MDG6935869.1 hypothetical protein [Nitrososphaerota archaeon]MDG6944190.1 hypothetical protein [Nitrososphaerota archaeon]
MEASPQIPEVHDDNKKYLTYIKGVLEDLTRKERLLWFLIIFEFLVIITMIGAGQPVPASSASTLVNGVTASIPYSSGTEAIALSIFKNNYTLALFMAIPLAGPFLSAYTSFNTGYIMSAQASVYSQQLQIAYTGIDRFLGIMVTPVFWLEFVCYSAAVLESIYLTKSLFTGNFRDELARAVVVIIGIAIVLFLSAQVEAFLYI